MPSTTCAAALTRADPGCKALAPLRGPTPSASTNDRTWPPGRSRRQPSHQARVILLVSAARVRLVTFVATEPAVPERVCGRPRRGGCKGGAVRDIRSLGGSSADDASFEQRRVQPLVVVGFLQIARAGQNGGRLLSGVQAVPSVEETAY